MASFGGAAARARVAPAATSSGPIRNASASTSSASRSILGAGPRRFLRRAGEFCDSRVSSTRASATPSTGGAGGGGTRASRRRERRALAKGATSDPPDPPSGGGSRAVDAKRVPAPTGALVVDARGVAVGRDGAVPNAGSDQAAEAQTPDEAETTKPASDVGATASQKRRAAGQTRLAVETFRQTHLGAAASVPEALRVLRAAVVALANDTDTDGSPSMFSSGLVRFTASVPRHVDALEWLRGAHSNANLQIDARSRLLPAYYLSPRTPPPAVRSGDGDDAAGDGDDVTYGRGAGTTASGASEVGSPR